MSETTTANSGLKLLILTFRNDWDRMRGSHGLTHLRKFQAVPKRQRPDLLVDGYSDVEVCVANMVVAIVIKTTYQEMRCCL